MDLFARLAAIVAIAIATISGGHTQPQPPPVIQPSPATQAAVTPPVTQPTPATQATAATKTVVASPSPQLSPVPSALPGGCEKEIDGARLGPPSTYVVELNSDTYWRPRGTEVKFIVSGTSGTPPRIKRVWVCFRWQHAHEAPKSSDTGYTPSPLVHNVPNTSGAIEYAAMVPRLRLPTRGTGANENGVAYYSFVHLVPIAEMQVLVELEDNSWFAAVLPVGITNVIAGIIIVLAALVVTSAALWLCAPKKWLAGASGWNLHNVSRHTLAIISTSNGVASLSQFQIMLWTFVVGGGAVYVMALSGDLIAISSGSLTLLGIAGAASVLARVPAPDADPPTNAGVVEQTLQMPLWCQLLMSDPADPEIDVTRAQMLIFTLITAAFVGIKIAVTYSIPEIPDNFLVLMGISNGVYIAGRHLPSSKKGRANPDSPSPLAAAGGTGPPVGTS